MTLRDQLQERYGKPHLSYSSLKHALGDMRKWEMYMRGEIKYSSDALTFGNVYDCLLLTPSQFEQQYQLMDDEWILEQCSAKTKLASRPKSTKEFIEARKDLERGKPSTNEQDAHLQRLHIAKDWRKDEDVLRRNMAVSLLFLLRT